MNAALPWPSMCREACCLQLGELNAANWNRSFTREKRLLHPTTARRPSTNELLTELKTFSSFQLKSYKDNFTNSLTKIERRLNSADSFIFFFSPFNSSHAIGVKQEVNLHIRSFKAFRFVGTYVTVLVHSFSE